MDIPKGLFIKDVMQELIFQKIKNENFTKFGTLKTFVSSMTIPFSPVSTKDKNWIALRETLHRLIKTFPRVADNNTFPKKSEHCSTDFRFASDR